MTDPAAHTPDVDTLMEKLTIALTWVPWDRRREADAALSELAARARESYDNEFGMKIWRNRTEIAERRVAELDKVLLNERRWIENAAVVNKRLDERVAELEAALRSALDCKGPYNGTVSERGGGSALCVKCVESIESALLGDGGES